MACINTWRCNLEDCCSGFTYEMVPLNFLCDVNINDYIDPHSGKDMTILWTGDSTNPQYSGYAGPLKCYKITYALQGSFIDGSWSPDPEYWYSGLTGVRDSCVSCITINPCPPDTPLCPETQCFKCRRYGADATTTGDCAPYIYSGCVELRDSQTLWVGRNRYDVQGWWQGYFQQVWRAIPSFYPAWPKNVSWANTNPEPCPSNNGTQQSNEIWYDLREVPFGTELPMGPSQRPTPWGYLDLGGLGRRSVPTNGGEVWETWWHIGSHTGDIDMTFTVPDSVNYSPMRIIVYWNDIMFCDSGFVGRITAGRNSTQTRLTEYWSQLGGIWVDYRVGCGWEQELVDLPGGKKGTCGVNKPLLGLPWSAATITSQPGYCYTFTPPSYSTTNPANYALRSYDRDSNWGSVTFADGRTFQQYGSPGQIGVVPDYPRNGNVRSTNGHIKLRFNKNLPEPTYCKIFIVSGYPQIGNDVNNQLVEFNEMICNGLS